MCPKTLHEFFMDAWRWSAGLPPREITRLPPPNDILQSQWSKEFELLMKNRMIMGMFRYGPVQEKGYKNIPSIQKRLDLYRKTGNAEHLVDIANLAMVEYMQKNHPSFHFHGEDDGYHTEEER